MTATDRIRELDQDLAPGSETALLGDALRSLADDPSPANLAWWIGAYRLLAFGLAYPERWDRDVGRRVWSDPTEQILQSGDDWTGWVEPTPTGADLRAWREREDLTQARAAEVAGVRRLAWARWESGTRSVPQWLPDVLVQRWGMAP